MCLLLLVLKRRFGRAPVFGCSRLNPTPSWHKGAIVQWLCIGLKGHLVIGFLV